MKNNMTSNDKSDWVAILRADIAVTGSISKTARRVGVSRPALSQILNGIGPYGSGKASTAKVEEKVMRTIGLVTCPFLSGYHAEPRRITGLQCREYAYRPNPPTNIPREMQHWRACRDCDKRVEPAVPATTVTVEKTGKTLVLASIAKTGKAASNDITYREDKNCIDDSQISEGETE